MENTENPNAQLKTAQEATIGQSESEDLKAFKSFSTKEDWQREIDRLIGSRLKDYRELKAENERLSSEMSFISDDEMKKEIENLVLSYPDADPLKLMDNKEFTDALKKGLPADKAYAAFYLDDILKNACKNAADNALLSISEKQNRIPELATELGSGQQLSRNPLNLTFDEIDLINERVRRGEKIKF